MHYPSTDIARHVMQERVHDSLRRAARRRMLLEAGICERSPVMRLACPILVGLGHLLVETGRRLQTYGASHTAFRGGVSVLGSRPLG